LVEHTLDHEYREALMAIGLAVKSGISRDYIKKNYKTSAKLRDKISEFGGEAHDMLEAEFPGGRKAFTAVLDREHDIVYGKHKQASKLLRAAQLLSK